MCVMVSFRAESRKCVSFGSIKGQSSFLTPLEMTAHRDCIFLYADQETRFDSYTSTVSSINFPSSILNSLSAQW
jgi:hypothetical protein